MDLRYAKVTPGIAGGYNSKQFLIRYVTHHYSTHPVIVIGSSIQRDSSQHLYLLSAGSDQEALTWIEKLQVQYNIASYHHALQSCTLYVQEKRSEYIKVSSAIEDNAQVQEKERKVFRPPNTTPASVLAANGKPFS